MVVVAAGRQIENLLARARYLAVAGSIAEPQHGIRVGDIQLVAAKPHTERQIQIRGECLADLRAAVAVGVTQQRDPVRRFAQQARALEAFEQRRRNLTADLFRARLRHQHVAIRQHVQPPRVVETAGEQGDPEPGGRLWHLTRLPAGDCREIDAWRLARFRRCGSFGDGP